MGTLNLQPHDATFGATVTGVSLASIDDSLWDEIESAFHEYAVLVFPGQHLSLKEQTAFASRFGNIEELAAGIKLVKLSNKLHDGSLARDGEHLTQILRGVEVWHADSSYMPLAAKGAVLSAEVVPPEGGQTEWGDMRAAYDSLEQEMKDRVAGLSAYHSLFYSQGLIGHKVAVGAGYGFDDDKTAPLRPLVKIHPVTGRPSLMIGRHAYGIPGLEADESQRLLDDLLAFACQAPRIYLHQWSPGDVVVWDNRCLMHRARPYDHHHHARTMRHVRIAGDLESEMADLLPVS